MKTVNLYMLNDILNPLGGSADVDEKSYLYENLDNNDEAAVKEVISKEIGSYYKTTSLAYRDSLKRSLAYFLITKKIDFGRLYDSCLIAFDHPKNPRDFFLWIWETLFPDEPYDGMDVGEYTEVDDVSEPVKYFL